MPDKHKHSEQFVILILWKLIKPIIKIYGKTTKGFTINKAPTVRKKSGKFEIQYLCSLI